MLLLPVIRKLAKLKNKAIRIPTCQVFHGNNYFKSNTTIMMNSPQTNAIISTESEEEVGHNENTGLRVSEISHTLHKLNISHGSSSNSITNDDGDKNESALQMELKESTAEADVEYQLFNDDVLGRNDENLEHKISKVERRKQSNEDNLNVWRKLMKQPNVTKKPYPHFKSLRNRPLTDATAVFRHNAWDNIEWDKEMQDQADAAILKNTQTIITEDQRNILELEAGANWDKFYEKHQNKFFKNRNWLFAEFPELEGPFGCSVTQEGYDKGIKEKRHNETYPGENSGFKVLEIGCGVGNTVFPLLTGNNNPESYLYCCDFSATAINIVKNHEQLDKNRCTPFVLDITDENAATPFPPNSIDAIILVFVLSAISPEKFDNAIRQCHKFLKPGGVVLFRDYGRYDLAQLRFKDGKCISENFYKRGDGTRVFFFTLDEVENLFSHNGFTKLQITEDRRLQVNRSKQLKMYRIWILGKFVKTSY